MNRLVYGILVGSMIVSARPALAFSDCANYENELSRFVTYNYNSGQPVSGMAISEGRLYVAHGEFGLQIWDQTDPRYPQLVGILDTPAAATSVAVNGNFVTIADTDRLRIADVSNPAAPQLLGSTPSLGTIHAVVVAGNWAYLACGTQGIRAVNVSNPSAPAVVGTFTHSGADFRDLVHQGDYIYAVSATVVVMLSVVDPTFPPYSEVASHSMTGVSWRNLAQSGQYLYVTQDAAPQLSVIHIDDLGFGEFHLSPVTTRTFASSIGRGVAVSGDFLYVCSQDLLTFYIGSPGDPLPAGSLYDEPIVTWYPTIIVAADGFGYGMGFSSPALGFESLQLHAEPLASLPTTSSPGRVALKNDHAFVVNGNSGLQVIAAEDPANPVVIGSIDTPGTATDVALLSNLALVTQNAPSAIQIVNVSDPTSPMITGSLQLPGEAYGIAVFASIAFIASGSSGLQIVDLNSIPPILGSIDTPGTALQVAVAGSHAFVVDQGVGLQIIDVEDPRAPTLLATLPSAPNTSVQDVALQGGYAYVVGIGIGLQVVDVSNPSLPQVVGSVGSGWWGVSVDVLGHFAYVTDYAAGSFVVIDVSNPLSPEVVNSIRVPPNEFGTWLVTGLAVSDAAVCVTDMGQRLHFYRRQCSPLPDLRFEAAPGWDSPIVARASEDASPTDCRNSPFLIGDSQSTFFNFMFTNHSEDGVHAAAPWASVVEVDGVPVREVIDTVGLSPFEYRFWNNLAPVVVAGGRHRVRVTLDAYDQVDEYVELDYRSQQFVWSPVTLTPLEILLRPSPPTSFVWEAYPVCDGLHIESSGGSRWMAAGVQPIKEEAQYDVRFHVPSTGSLDGFADVLVSSSDATPGDVEFCLVNCAVASEEKFDVGVVNANGGPGDYKVQRVDAVHLGPILDGITSTGDLDFGEQGFLALFEIEVASQFVGIPVHLSVRNDASDSDIRVDLFDGAIAYHAKSGGMSWADAAGPGGDEHLPPVIFPQEGFYAIAVTQHGASAAFRTSSAFEILISTTGPIVGVPVLLAPPLCFALSEPRPNPSRGPASFEFTVPAAGGTASICVYDLGGRRVTQLASGDAEPGRHVLHWNGRDSSGREVAAGVYFVRLEAPNVRENRKITLLR